MHCAARACAGWCVPGRPRADDSRRAEVRLQLADRIRARGAVQDPAGSKILGIGKCDNSPKNKWNPAPNLEFYWSEQSWDEMYQPFTLYSVDSQTLSDMTVSKTPQQKQ
jgi:hypothetical protein